ncbi:MAG: phospholipase D-like domain-containing protein, partial [Candidatus Dormibacteraeota bacterium]|nr:phospholipase D-like domain-containing protein [Candidatus Dormibacteraeota bacterium]
MTRLTCALGPDSAGTLLRHFLRGARERLDVAMYEVGPSYGWMFPEAMRKGARVRVLLDGHGGVNRGCLEELARAAEGGTVVPCRMVRRHAGADAHWKLLAADDDRLAVGTGNLDERDAPSDHGGLLPPHALPRPGTREWWAFIEGAPTLTAMVRTRFSLAWRQALPPPRLWAVEEAVAAPPIGAPTPAVPPLELELAPRRLRVVTDARAVLELLESTLESASQRVLLTVPYLHAWAPPVRPLLARLTDLQRAGTDVRILLGAEPAAGDAAAILDRGIPSRVMDPDRCTTGHAKGLVVDGVAVVMSSNWSSTGLGGSLESALHIDHPLAAEYYADFFERDWA